MNSKIACRECQEPLPLLFAGSLSASEKELVLQHVDSCSECKKMSERERVLYEISKVDSAASPLTSHLESALIDGYVFAKSSLTSAQIIRIERHLGECGTCREVIENLRRLPDELDDLVDPKELPLLTRMANASRQKPNILKIGRRILWQPLIGYAAAAAILLTTILFRPSPVSEPSATVSGVIPSSLRGDEQTVVFESSSPQCVLDLKYHVAPEAGHQYDFEIRPETAEKPVQSLRAFRNFDAQGNADLRVLLEVGKYHFVIRDIAGGDSVVVVRSFEIRLSTK
jgi:predicted anti-sigma-YlaC factor YlaD